MPSPASTRMSSGWLSLYNITHGGPDQFSSVLTPSLRYISIVGFGRTERTSFCTLKHKMGRCPTFPPPSLYVLMPLGEIKSKKIRKNPSLGSNPRKCIPPWQSRQAFSYLEMTIQNSAAQKEAFWWRYTTSQLTVKTREISYILTSVIMVIILYELHRQT